MLVKERARRISQTIASSQPHWTQQLSRSLKTNKHTNSGLHLIQWSFPVEGSRKPRGFKDGFCFCQCWGSVPWEEGVWRALQRVQEQRLLWKSLLILCAWLSGTLMYTHALNMHWWITKWTSLAVSKTAQFAVSFSVWWQWLTCWTLRFVLTSIFFCPQKLWSQIWRQKLSCPFLGSRVRGPALGQFWTSFESYHSLSICMAFDKSHEDLEQLLPSLRISVPYHGWLFFMIQCKNWNLPMCFLWDASGCVWYWCCLLDVECPGLDI